MMKNHIFLGITETLEEQEDPKKIDFSTCPFEYINFNIIKASPSPFNNNHCNVFKAQLEVFRETFPELSLSRHIENVIYLKGSIPKAQTIYRLKTVEYEALQEHLANTLM